MVGCVNESSGGTVSYFAAAVVRETDGWSAAEVSLSDAADVEDVADRLRDVAPAADVSLLFVESDDVYLAILRLDQGEDLRVFGSDVAFAEESRIGALLLGDVASPLAELDAVDVAVVRSGALADVDVDADDLDAAGAASSIGRGPATSGEPVADVDPAGDPELLADLGVPAAKLIELCSQEGMLPSDITAEVCQAIGCGDEVEELREA
jgi:putative tRNA adenosine deaminase-associated protein